MVGQKHTKVPFKHSGKKIFGRPPNRFGRGGRWTDFNQKFQNKNVERVVLLGHLMHTCQGDLVIKSEIHDVPYFSAPVYLEDKKPIGKIDEIFGSVKDHWMTVKLNDNVALVSFMSQEKLFIEPNKLLPLQRFLPRSLPPKISNRKNVRGPQGHANVKQIQGNRRPTSSWGNKGRTGRVLSSNRGGRGIPSNRGKWRIPTSNRGGRQGGH